MAMAQTTENLNDNYNLGKGNRRTCLAACGHRLAVTSMQIPAYGIEYARL